MELDESTTLGLLATVMGLLDMEWGRWNMDPKSITSLQAQLKPETVNVNGQHWVGFVLKIKILIFIKIKSILNRNLFDFLYYKK